MADGEPGSADLTPWQPNPRAIHCDSRMWWGFTDIFRESSASGYYVERYGCYDAARRGIELAVRQWKAWELHLAEAKLMGDLK